MMLAVDQFVSSLAGFRWGGCGGGLGWWGGGLGGLFAGRLFPGDRFSAGLAGR